MPVLELEAPLRVRPAAASSHQDLCERFLTASANAAERLGGWLEVWRLVIQHPWYRQELAAAARLAVRRVCGPVCWREDVEQEAVLLLAQKLRRDPTLGLDPFLAERHFAGWFGRIIRNDCRQAVRKLRRQNREAQLPSELIDGRVWQSGTERDRRIDLSLTIEQLHEPDRTVLLLSANGCSLTEISKRLGLSYWKVWRAFRDGCGRVSSLLA